MAILKKTTVVAKPAAKPAAKVMMKARAEEMFKASKAAKPMAKKEPTFSETMNRKFKQGDAYAMAKNIKNDLVKPVVKAVKSKYNEVFGETPKSAAKPVVKSTLQKTMVDTKNGKVIKVTKSAPVAVKMKSITEKEFNTDGKTSKFERNIRSQRGAMDKIATYSKKALQEQTGYGALAGYAKAGKRESPTDSVIKYSNELMKLRKKK